MSSGDRIRVVARIRPLLTKEISRNDDVVTHVSENNTKILLESRSASSISRNYKLDKILDESHSQLDVFSHVTPLINDLFQGFNCSLFTYGQTGTGKTHTMLGYDLWSMAQQADNNDGVELGSKYPEISRDELNMGIIPRSMMNIFEQMDDDKNSHIEYRIFISYIEIYNEKIKDLLTYDPDSDLSLEIRESKRGEISVTNLVEVEVQNVAQVFEVLWSGAQARCIATTDMNDYSSRSHTIFQVRMTQTSVSSVSGNSTTKRGKLCFIDLAGSEKWKSHQLSQFSQERIKELTSINKSLSALGNCISALLRDKGKHVPYRDSKLTRLLQDSLGGNTKTLFIVTLSPSVSCLDETTSTLQFADRAMKVQIFAAPNISESVGNNSGDSELMAERYRQEILNLKAIIQSLLHKEKTGANGESPENNGAESGSSGSNNKRDVLESNMAEELTALRDENYALQQRLGQLSGELSFSQSLFNKLSAKMLGSDAYLQSQAVSVGGGDIQSSTDNNNAHADMSNIMQSPLSKLRPLLSAQRSAVDEVTDSVVPEEESELRSTSSVVFTAQHFHTIYTAQLNAIDSLLLDVERRAASQSEVDVAQEERWQALLKYHSWLQSQAQMRVDLDVKQQQHIQNGTSSNEDDDEDNVMQRVNLIETSLLYQSDELFRAKTSFLKTNNDLQLQLKESQQHVAVLQESLLELHRQSASSGLEISEGVVVDVLNRVAQAVASSNRGRQSHSTGTMTDGLVFAPGTVADGAELREPTPEPSDSIEVSPIPTPVVSPVMSTPVRKPTPPSFPPPGTQTKPAAPPGPRPPPSGPPPTKETNISLARNKAAFEFDLGAPVVASKPTLIATVETKISPKAAPNTPPRTTRTSSEQVTSATSTSSSILIDGVGYSDPSENSGLGADEHHLLERKKNTVTRIPLMKQPYMPTTASGGQSASKSPSSYRTAAQLRHSVDEEDQEEPEFVVREVRQLTPTVQGGVSAKKPPHSSSAANPSSPVVVDMLHVKKELQRLLQVIDGNPTAEGESSKDNKQIRALNFGGDSDEPQFVVKDVPVSSRKQQPPVTVSLNLKSFAGGSNATPANNGRSTSTARPPPAKWGVAPKVMPTQSNAPRTNVREPPRSVSASSRQSLNGRSAPNIIAGAVITRNSSQSARNSRSSTPTRSMTPNGRNMLRVRSNSITSMNSAGPPSVTFAEPAAPVTLKSCLRVSDQRVEKGQREQHEYYPVDSVQVGINPMKAVPRVEAVHSEKIAPVDIRHIDKQPSRFGDKVKANQFDGNKCLRLPAESDHAQTESRTQIEFKPFVKASHSNTNISEESSESRLTKASMRAAARVRDVSPAPIGGTVAQSHAHVQTQLPPQRATPPISIQTLPATRVGVIPLPSSSQPLHATSPHPQSHSQPISQPQGYDSDHSIQSEHSRNTATSASSPTSTSAEDDLVIEAAIAIFMRDQNSASKSAQVLKSAAVAAAAAAASLTAQQETGSGDNSSLTGEEREEVDQTQQQDENNNEGEEEIQYKYRQEEEDGREQQLSADLEVTQLRSYEYTTTSSETAQNTQNPTPQPEEHLCREPVEATRKIAAILAKMTEPESVPVAIVTDKPRTKPRRSSSALIVEAKKAVKTGPKPLWREYTDPKTALHYYHNRLTAATTWTRPSDADMRLVVLEDGVTVVDIYDMDGK